MSTIKNVALLGADGKLGPAILNALVAHKFKVTVLKRASSTSPSNYPAIVDVVKCPDAFDVESMTTILSGQDAIVVTIKGSQVDIQKRLADAALRAGIKRFIPADFGSCDSSSKKTQDLVPLYRAKTEIRDYLQGLVQTNSGSEREFGWTAIVPAHFFDAELSFLHIFLEERKVDILGKGDIPHSLSTLERIGEATARALQRPMETRDKTLYVQSFCVTQMDVVKAYEKATGQAWEVTEYDPETFVKEQKVKADAGDATAVEDCVWYLGVVDADWRNKGEGFAMKMLDLEDENLDEVVQRCVKKFSKA